MVCPLGVQALLAKARSRIVNMPSADRKVIAGMQTSLPGYRITIQMLRLVYDIYGGEAWAKR